MHKQLESLMSGRSDSPLGKIFLSHSSVDKPFVRRLAKTLAKHRYEVWLDEKDLKVGDPLADAISKAIETSRVVMVVISASALKSSWLSYELNIATQRMAKGHLRLLPILIGDVEVPSAVQALLYADCRHGRRGIKTILKTLEYEASRYPPSLASLLSASRTHIEARTSMIEKELGGIGSITSLGAFRDDWQTISIDRVGDSERADVLFEDLRTYGYDGRLTLYEWVHFTERLHHLRGQSYGLVISEYRPDEDVKAALSTDGDNVYYFAKRDEENDFDRVVVLVDVSDRPSESTFSGRLSLARKLLFALINRDDTSEARG